jgi:hypothetical protein
MNRSIYVEYESGGRKGSRKFWCATPLSALSGMAYYLQVKLKKKPGDYKITRVYQSYIGGDGLNHDSDFDLPGGPNPDVNEHKQKQPGPEQASLGF